MWPKSFQGPLPPEELDNVDGIYAYLGGRVIPLREARVSVTTHAFLYGTALEVTLVESVDRRVIGDGSAYPIAEKLKTLYLNAVRVKKKEYEKWLTPVYGHR